MKTYSYQKLNKICTPKLPNWSYKHSDTHDESDSTSVLLNPETNAIRKRCCHSKASRIFLQEDLERWSEVFLKYDNFKRWETEIYRVIISIEWEMSCWGHVLSTSLPNFLPQLKMAKKTTKHKRCHRDGQQESYTSYKTNQQPKKKEIRKGVICVKK